MAKLFKMQKCKITSWKYEEMVYTLQKSNVAYTRCMTTTGFKWQAVRSQEINTGQREQEYSYISLKIHLTTRIQNLAGI